MAAGRLRLAALALLVAGCSNAASTDAGVPDFASTIPCHTDGDCPAALPVCEPLAQVCVGCIPHMMTCPNAGDVCDETTHRCVPGTPGARCVYNSDCAFPNVVCHKATGGCVPCLTDDDCPDPSLPFCDSIFGDMSSFTCRPNCDRCRDPFPICEADFGLCCPVDGGGCHMVH